MKKYVVVGIILILIGLALTPTITANTTKSMSSETKNTITVDDEGDGDFIHIQDAVDTSNTGDIIEVYSGTYTENIIVDKQLTLNGIPYELDSGNDTGMPIVHRGAERQIFTLTADGCNFSGFDLRDDGFTLDGILVLSDNNKIFNNTVRSNFGIHLYESSNNRVYDNYLRDCNVGILIAYGSNDNRIYKNIMADNSYGIKLFYYSVNNLIYENNIESSYSVGISEWISNNNTIFENEIHNCVKEGIKIETDDGYGYGYLVYDNIISNCRIGIRIASWDNTIYHNEITNCEFGIYFIWIYYTFPPMAPHHNTITDNIIKNNNEGIYADGGAYNNITGNTITDNVIFGLYLKEFKFGNIVGNNITDNQKDGINFDSSHDNLISKNNIINNSKEGIQFFDSYRNTISENNIINNDQGILLSYCHEDTIRNNNLIDNTIDAFFEDCYLNLWLRNYWNRARAFPKIIFGIQYEFIPWINIDFLPAREPYEYNYKV